MHHLDDDDGDDDHDDDDDDDGGDEGDYDADDDGKLNVQHVAKTNRTAPPKTETWKGTLFQNDSNYCSKMLAIYKLPKQ